MPPLSITIPVITSLNVLAWIYLLAWHGGFWRTSHRLPAPGQQPHSWPSVTAVIPARDEADILPQTLPTLLTQDYPGQFTVILVDDESTDDTGAVAARLDEDGHLMVINGSPTPKGWAGKVWAMQQGLEAATGADYVLFTDADISYSQGTLTSLVQAAGDRALVSQMAMLRCDNAAERLLIPAFVYFFAQLYPFRLVSTRRNKIAAAAGGCMLVRRDALIKARGFHDLSHALIDDVALGTLLKRAGHDIWLGFTSDVTSRRPYHFAQVWNMVARSAYTQLRYSPPLLGGTVVGLAWLYLIPPAATVVGLAALPRPAAGALAVLGAIGWALMAITYVPMLRLYHLNPVRALTLPLIAALYAGMTISSALRHFAGRGGEWKGRYSNASGGGQAQTRLRSP